LLCFFYLFLYFFLYFFLFFTFLQALNPEIESQLYEEMTTNSNVTVISIAHRLALSKYHDARLHIVGDGSGDWSLEQLEPR